ncbi:MAG: alkaline phosphatase PhoX [Cumulibacter sp.]
MPNQSGNEYFGDVLKAALSRRRMLQATAVVGAAGAAAVTLGSTPASAAPPVEAPGLRFPPIEPSVEDAVVFPEGYQQQVVIRWGDPILTGAPAFDPNNQTVEAQLGQFGYNCDFLGFFDLAKGKQLVMTKS